MRVPFFYSLLCLSFFACKNENSNTSGKNSLPNKPDILASHLDTSIHPGDDFFNYANGTWFKNNPIPASERGWGIFSVVKNENETRLRKISEEASATSGKQGSAMQLIGDFFSAGMDSIKIEQAGIKPLQQELDRINSAKSYQEILSVVAHLQTIGIDPLYDIGIYQDLKNSNKNALYLSQGGLGLPDRDYYFNTDKNTTDIRNAYKAYIARVFSLLGDDGKNSTLKSNSVFNFETNLAKKHRKLEDLRDPEKNYNKVSTQNLIKNYNNIDFANQLKNLNIAVDSVIIGQPEFYENINTLCKTTNLETLKNYLTFQTVASLSPFLSTNFDKANFDFYSGVMNGVKVQKPRWQRVMAVQENALGDAMGELYVKQYFSEKTKKRYEIMVDNVMLAYKEHIEKLDWMSDSTKQKALKKLSTITKKIGYPNKFRDYSAMKITRDSYLQNVLESNKWHFNYQTAKLTKPVDRTEWDMTPQTYNAYYNPSNNEIVIPAAMFTAPGYNDDELDDAVMYGYVGASTIGHELTHGFDDEGRKYDEIGNLNNWWNKSDEEKFTKKATALVDQFNKMTVCGNLHPNGKASLGENIADLGGVVIALDAFKKTQQYKENKMLGGLTPTQRYFLGYAYGWMEVRRDEVIKQNIMTDVHAPINLRVNGPFSNSDEWYKAFNVEAKHKLYRDSTSRVRIW